MKKYIMTLDQGTTSSRCILFDKDSRIVSMAQREFAQIFPRDGYVEHDAMTIFATQIGVASEALMKIGGAWDEIAGIGITNQRETTVVWNRATGEPICNAIGWQCRRTADLCLRMKNEGLEPMIHEKTGLFLDPYFSATKLSWILDNVPQAREMAERGELCFGTIDSFLIFRLTGGRVHATDPSNASRTMLYNLHTGTWDDELLSLFRIPRSMLPEIKPSSGLFGYTDASVLGASLPIAGVAGDQQAALFGQACFREGDFKNTYGTGGFLLMNTGDAPALSDQGLLTTVAWQIGDRITYALEGSVFVCGAAIQWLRDSMKIIENATDSEYYARKVEDTAGVTVVPAFQGLGAPFWDPYARGTILGITRLTNKYHIIRATLESLAYQTSDVLTLMRECTGLMSSDTLRVDGGAAENSFLLEFQADVLGMRVERPDCIETTARGAAWLCGLALGFYTSFDDLRQKSKAEIVFLPTKDDAWRARSIRIWRRAVDRARAWAIEESEDS